MIKEIFFHYFFQKAFFLPSSHSSLRPFCILSFTKPSSFHQANLSAFFLLKSFLSFIKLSFFSTLTEINSQQENKRELLRLSPLIEE